VEGSELGADQNRAIIATIEPSRGMKEDRQRVREWRENNSIRAVLASLIAACAFLASFKGRIPVVIVG
jgi:hypothetical protein